MYALDVLNRPNTAACVAASCQASLGTHRGEVDVRIVADAPGEASIRAMRATKWHPLENTTLGKRHLWNTKSGAREQSLLLRCMAKARRK